MTEFSPPPRPAMTGLVKACAFLRFPPGPDASASSASQTLGRSLPAKDVDRGNCSGVALRSKVSIAGFFLSSALLQECHEELPMSQK
jgi:hypothetical protein